MNKLKQYFAVVAIAIMTAISAQAQKIEVVDAEGHGIPLVSVLNEDGTFIGATDMSGCLNDVKGAEKVALTHVAYQPQLVTVASLPNGRVTMKDIDYGLEELVVKPKPYIYVEIFYRVYVYRNDSLCYFNSGIMPNAFDPQKKKLEHGNYNHARAEHCNKMGAAVTWTVRAQRLGAGEVPTGSLEAIERLMKDRYFISATIDNPNHTTYSNPEGVVGQQVRTGGQLRITLDAGKSQMYANKAKGQTKLLEKRQDVGYDYQYTRVYKDNKEKDYDIASFMMVSNHWEYNDKKSHVKFIIENYATDHYYMDKKEWKAKKKSVKEDFGTQMSLDQLAAYERQHNIPVLPAATRQAIGKLKQW